MDKSSNDDKTKCNRITTPAESGLAQGECKLAYYQDNFTTTMNPNDVSQQYPNAQAQKASQAQMANAAQKTYQSIADPFPESLSAITGYAGIAQSGTLGHSNLARSAAGRSVLGNNLQDEAANVRSQSDQLKNCLAGLENLLFEPEPTLNKCGEIKDNPSTVEGSVQTASRSLAIAILTLERVISKIGGR